MSESVRAFLSISLGGEVRSTLGVILHRVEAAGAPGVRLVRPESIHLTLKFLGDTSGPRIDAVKAAVGQAVRDERRFGLTLGRPGVFPSRRSPRVLWIGLDGDLDRLADLQQRVEEAVGTAGFAREARRFTPHLTIGRVRERTDRDRTLPAVEALLAADIPTDVRIDVRSVHLMRSILLPTGAAYDVLAELPLAEGA